MHALSTNAGTLDLLYQMFINPSHCSKDAISSDAPSLLFLFVLVIILEFLLPWSSTLFKRWAGLIPPPEDTSLNQVYKDVVAVAKLHNFKPNKNLFMILISSLFYVPLYSLSMYLMSIYMDGSGAIINIVILFAFFIASVIHHYIDLPSAIGSHSHC